MSDSEIFTFNVDDHGTLREVTIDADMQNLLDGEKPFISGGVVLLRSGLALHRVVHAKRHALEMKSVPRLDRSNNDKLDCRSANLVPKLVSANVLFIPRDEVRSILHTDYGKPSVGMPLLIPAKYVPEARRIGIPRPADTYSRYCRACGKMATGQETLEVRVQREQTGGVVKWRIHNYECIAADQEVQGSVTQPEAQEYIREFREKHPEYYPSENVQDDSEYDYEDGENDRSQNRERWHYRLTKTPSEIIVYISRNERPCPLCKNVQIGSGLFEESCNHLISAHRLECFYVGSETHVEESVNHGVHTVAVFRKKITEINWVKWKETKSVTIRRVARRDIGRMAREDAAAKDLPKEHGSNPQFEVVWGKTRER
jgi:hypothetical protein